MNKKSTAIVTSLALGGILLFGTAFVNASQLSGYQSFKGAVNDTKNLKNGTINLQLAVSDNGNNIINANSNVKLNLNANAMSSVTTVKSGSDTQTFNSYKQDGKSITKDNNSNEYIVKQNGSKNINGKDKVENPAVSKSVEVVMDTLVGSMQNKVSVTGNTDGTKKDSINLNSSEITPLSNALASIALIRNDNEAVNYNKVNLNSLKNVIPQLQSNIKIESINSNGDINKNDVITDQTAVIVLSGDDANGKQHNIKFDINLTLSNINNTTPDKVDLNGKQVKTITSHFGE
ncbi:hypothetical protein [Clostridium pasteurianum]|uniref:Uncharacterized protein n=1 Tax=Clostridium pasteurianum BC1 TaxID=86416 RepID=R4K0U6_CLOPA|nr:hypothetical protein [Clostridium pasteurianum]AGK96712.1 hypothetical protein Clopa_1805 [Clostridium pasteurianum BC1]